MKKVSTDPVKSIVITFNGAKTYATLLTSYAGATRVRSAEAKCAPDDVFTTYEGARIALARLFGVDPFPVDDEPQFNVGDIVRLNGEDHRRNMVEDALGEVVGRAPNKMTPYAVRILSDGYARTPYDVVVMPGEMRLIEEAAECSR